MGSTSRRSPPEPPQFFVDRALGRHQVPKVFRAAGFHVVLMADLWPNGTDQLVGDDEWIAAVDSLGLVALTKDANIHRAHATALSGSTLRLFALPNANMRGTAMAERFDHHLHRIVWRSRRPGPFVDVIGPTRIERRWPPTSR